MFILYIYNKVLITPAVFNLTTSNFRIILCKIKNFFRTNKEKVIFFGFLGVIFHKKPHFPHFLLQ